MLIKVSMQVGDVDWCIERDVDDAGIDGVLRSCIANGYFYMHHGHGWGIPFTNRDFVWRRVSDISRYYSQDE